MWPEMTPLVTLQHSPAAGQADSALARTSGGLEIVTPDHTCVGFFLRWELLVRFPAFSQHPHFQLGVQRPVLGLSPSLQVFPVPCSANRAIINSQDARQPDSARRQEISPNYYIHIVSNAHFTASANLKWQVPTFHSQITIFVPFYYMVIFVHYLGSVNLVL